MAMKGQSREDAPGRWIRWVRLGVAAVLGVSIDGVARAADAGMEYEKEIRPLLEKKCFECHNGEKQKGDLNLAQFKDFAAVQAQGEIWQKVLERVQSFEMPPKKAGELKFNEHQTLMKWLRELPKPSAVDCDQLASDRTANFYRGYVMSRRLNRAEYANTIRDLMGVEVSVLDLLPADGGGGEGFDTAGNALFLSSIHVEKYLAATDRVIETVVPDSERKLETKAREARRAILFEMPRGRSEARASAERVVKRFAERAWRRLVDDAEVGRLMALYDRGAARRDGFVASVRLALKGVLLSPHFLFLAEPEPREAGVQALGAVPLASKLSYFLWSSMPDERLMALARSGELLQPDVYLAEVRRMLRDPKAEAFGERFALQWLDVDRLGTEVKPDPTQYPEFDAELAESMRGELVAFFNDLVRNDRSLVNLIDSDYTLVNRRMAQWYGMEETGRLGAGWERVNFRGRERGGLVGMAAVQTLTSYPGRTSPVLRGKWVLESLLGEKVPPPPPDTPTLEETRVKASKLTFRQQLEVHRAKAECASCHDKMDPLGFGLENFDVLGRWRTEEKGQPIEAQGVLPNGRKFEGPAELRAILMDRRDDVMRNLARKMTGFAFGRELNKFDDCVIQRALEAMKAKEYRPSVLVESIVSSFPFRHRFYPKATDTE